MKYLIRKSIPVLIVILLLSGYADTAGAVSSNAFLSSAEGKEACPAGSVSVYFGDMDNNGVIEIQDVILLLKYIVDLYTSDDPEFVQRADVNLDGIINIRDAIMILRKKAGLIPDFTPVDPAVVSTETALRHVLEKTAVKKVNISGRITLSNTLSIEREITIGTLLIRAIREEGGRVEVAGTLGGPGTAFNLKSVFAKNYLFTGWTSGQELISTEEVISFTMPAKDTEITANFILITYNLETSSFPQGAGTVAGGGEHEEGKKVTLTALPADGFVFVNWTINGEASAEGAEFEYTMPAEDVHIVAIFRLDHYVPITSAEDLDNIRNEGPRIFGAGTVYEGEYEGGLDKHYLQCGDIDLGLAPYNEGNGWVPIGSLHDESYYGDNHPFTGSYHGNGYRIKKLTIDNAEEKAVGLFGYAGTDSKLVEITLDDVQVNGNLIVGGLVGLNEGEISDCYAAGRISGPIKTGGLVGYNAGKIKDSHVEVSVRGQQSWEGEPGEFEAEAFGAGGLAGLNTGDINGSYADGDVIAPVFVGGLVGYNDGRVEESYSLGTVTEIDTGDVFEFTGAGGLIGANGGTVLRSYARCNEVTGYKMVGGLVGVNADEIILCHAGFEAGEDDTARITGVYNVGGLVGASLDGNIMRCYATGDVTGTEDSFDFLNNIIAPSEIVVEGSIGILPSIMPQGLYEGQYVELPGVGGLVGLVIGGRISDHSYAEGLVTGGVIAGGLIGSNINGDIADCYSRGDVHGPYYVGGFAGVHFLSEIYCCHASGDVVGTDPEIALNYEDYPPDVAMMIGGRTGGLVGGNMGKIVCCCAEGEVRGYEVVGGLAAINGGNLEQCFSRGSVVNTDCETEGYLIGTGGLAGVNSADITDCYSLSSVSGDNVTGGLVGYHAYGLIKNCYAVGFVEGIEILGGLIGYAEDSGADVENSYFDQETTGQEISAGGEGRSTEEMTTHPYDPETVYLEWDFISIWDSDPAHNGGYPFLRCCALMTYLFN
ncbi:MAG: GLUG motif-containing protein [Dethiobacteria bacterium]